MTTTASAPTAKRRQFIHTPGRVEVRSEDLRPGVAGVVQGVAVTYGVVDSYGTRFALGSLDRTIRERVESRKVKVYTDHQERVRAHVGVVSTARTVGDSLVVDLDVFDTADGRAALEYVRAVLAAGAESGLSIGFVPIEWRIVRGDDGKGEIVEFTEVALREISLTPAPAVPGASVTGSRRDPEPDADPDLDDEDADGVTLAERAAIFLLESLPAEVRARLLARYEPAPSPASPATATSASPAPSVELTSPEASPGPVGTTTATLEERAAAVRLTFTGSPSR